MFVLRKKSIRLINNLVACPRGGNFAGESFYYRMELNFEPSKRG